MGLQVSLHDQTHIELDLDYPFEPRPSSKVNHELDIFFFLPKSLGVNSASYTRDQFYNDLTSYIRLRTPEGEPIEPEFRESIRKYFAEVPNVIEQESLLPTLLRHSKLFANRINARLKKLHERLSLHGAETEGEVAAALSDACLIHDLVQGFREEIVEGARKPSLRVDPGLRQTILLADEYVSNRMDATFSDLHHRATTAGMKAALLGILQRESSYRRSTGYIYDQRRTEAEREYFYYRHGLLKKFISQPLFISTHRAKQDRVYRNYVAAAGAGLAAVWSRFADLQAYRMASASDLGLKASAVLAFMVLAYILKDRIKEVSREYFNESLKGIFPDYKTKLRYSPPSEAPTDLGEQSEFMRYLDSDSVPSEILFLRRLRGRRDIESSISETVLHYHRKVRFEGEDLPPSLIAVKMVKDILRFNFGYFSNHLDDPLKHLSVYDEEEGSARVETPKVYHLNILVRTGKRKQSFAHYRVIMNKGGILRLETVTPAGLVTDLEVGQ